MPDKCRDEDLYVQNSEYLLQILLILCLNKGDLGYLCCNQVSLLKAVSPTFPNILPVNLSGLTKENQHLKEQGGNTVWIKISLIYSVL